MHLVSTVTLRQDGPGFVIVDLSVLGFQVFPMSVRVLARCSNFLPPSKDIHLNRLKQSPQIPQRFECESEWLFICIGQQ